MDCAGSFEPEGAEDDGPMSERILMKFIVGQRVVKEGEDSRFEGEVVAAFVKRNLKTLRYVVRMTAACCTSPASGNCYWPCLKPRERLEPSHSRGLQKPPRRLHPVRAPVD